MTQRIGVCKKCSARYKIPDTVTATQAKCKKCGGIVQIPTAGAAAKEGDSSPKKAPARSSSAGKTSRTSSRESSKSTTASKGRRGSRGRKQDADAEAGSKSTGRRSSRSGGGRSRGGRSSSRESAKKGPSPLLIAAGVLVVGGVGGLGWYMMDGDDDSTTIKEVANASSNENSTTEAAEGDANNAAEIESTEPVTNEELTSNSEPETDGTAEQLVADAEPADDAAAEEAPAEEEIVATTLIEFTPFGKNESTSDEAWQEIQDAVVGMADGGRARKRHMEKLIPHGLDALPALINTFNGTDLTDDIAWSDAFEVALFIQEDLIHGLISVPFKGDFSEEPKVINYNAAAIKNLVKYWRARQENPEMMARSVEIFEEKKAAEK